MTANESDVLPAERARRFREMADRARKNAETTVNEETRASYLRLAEGWESLAAQLERARPPA